MTVKHEYQCNFADARKTAAGALDAAAGTAPFARMDWFEQLHAGCLADTTPLILHCHDAAADAGLWLFLIAENATSARALANWYSFAWAPVFTGNAEPRVRAALIAHAATALKERCATLRLAPVPDAVAGPLGAALQRAGWQVDSRTASVNHWLEPAGRSFDDWWATRPGALRSTVRRKAAKGRVALSIDHEFDADTWAGFQQVYRDSWKPQEGQPAFLRDWAAREGAAGTLRLGTATIDGTPVAAQFWTTDNGVAHIHKLAHVTGQDALSPGTLLSHAMFRHAFDVDRVARIDFGTGDDGYKRDWTEQSASLHSITARNLAAPAAWPGWGRARISALAARLRAG